MPPSPRHPAPWTAHDWPRLLFWAAFLAMLGLYLPSLSYPFVYDDLDFIVDNPRVRQGLSLEFLRWCLTGMHASYWAPLVWLSHGVHHALFGLDPWGFRLTNVLVHGLCGWLLFHWLWRATRDGWPAAFVAAAFLLHPVNVESVVWVTEIKNTLSTALGLGAIWLYCQRAALPAPERAARTGSRLLLASLVLYAGSLMAKGMLVTLPVLLLLLDWWPLDRWRTEGWRALLREKLPYWLLALAGAGMTMLASARGNSLHGMGAGSLLARLPHVLTYYLEYLGMTLWPEALAAYYPEAAPPGAPAVAGATLLLLGSCWLAWRGRRLGWPLAGWGWFLLSLTPVIGLIRSGTHTKADRFLYLPAWGIFILLAWGGIRLWQGRRGGLSRGGKLGLAMLGLVALGVWSWRTAAQIPSWRSELALLEHAAALHPDSKDARIGLGRLRLQAGDHQAALDMLRPEMDAYPGYTALAADVALCLEGLGREDEAAAIYLRAAERARPEFSVFLRLAQLRLRQGDGLAALEALARGLAVHPDSVPLHLEAVQALLALRRPAEALAMARRAAELGAADAPALTLLGKAQLFSNDAGADRDALRRALTLDPGFFPAAMHLGQALGVLGDDRGALACFVLAMQLDPASPAPALEAARLLEARKLPEAARIFSRRNPATP